MSMHVQARHPAAPPFVAARVVVTGGLLFATLDLLYACSFWWLLRDVPPLRVLQYIASGALGREAFQGGAATALAGAAFHYAIAMAMVLAYYLASGRLRMLLQRPVLNGVLYGVLLWAVMTLVVVPLSLAEPSSKPVPLATALNFAMHLLLGVICAWTARRARGFR